MVRTKKFISGILMGLLCCLCFLFVGCFDKEIEGTYKFKSMTYTEGGMEIEIKAGEKFMGMMTISEDFMKITLNKDGTVVMVSSSFEDSTDTESETGTWSKSEKGKIAITFDGETQLCECDGKKLVFEEDGAKVILKK